MVEKVNLAQKKFDEYYTDFLGLSEEQSHNFSIKYEHSLRVAKLCADIAEKLELSETDKHFAYMLGLFHDIGRFKQFVEYNTFNDSKSVDHAEYSVQVLEEKKLMNGLDSEQKEQLLVAIQNHNKLEIQKGLTDRQMFFSQLIRDADKLDILHVLTDYYTNPKTPANHALTWEMPTGATVTPVVAKQILAGKLVSKDKVACEIDIKVMQLSWVYDFNFKPTFELLMRKRYLETIYSSLPKSDIVFDIYRKVKVYAENKFLV